MAPNLVDVYRAGAQHLSDVEPLEGARVAFAHAEKYCEGGEPGPWGQWFKDKPVELNSVLRRIQADASYHTYSEHFLGGMPHWDEDLLVSPTHVESVQSFGHLVDESVWHALGQRGNSGPLANMTTAFKNMALMDLMRHVGNSSSHGSAIGFYNGFLDEQMANYRSGGRCEKLNEWCARTVKIALPQTCSMFLEKYPDAGVLLVHHALSQHTSRMKDELNDFAKTWLLAHPEQHEALYAYVYEGPHVWATADDGTYGSDVAARVQDKSALMRNLFPDAKHAEDYFRTYTGLFFQPKTEASWALPSGMEP